MMIKMLLPLSPRPAPLQSRLAHSRRKKLADEQNAANLPEAYLALARVTCRGVDLSGGNILITIKKNGLS